MTVNVGTFDLQVAAPLHDIGASQVKADVMCQCQMICGILSWTVPACHSTFGHVTVLLC